MRKDSPFTISSLVCTQCGKVMYVPRSIGRAREKGHIKDMYCPNCKKSTRHIEIRHNDTIKDSVAYIEYYCGDFINENGEIVKIYMSGAYTQNNKTAVRFKFIAPKRIYDVTRVYSETELSVNRQINFTKKDISDCKSFIYSNDKLLAIAKELTYNLKHNEVVAGA